MPRVNGYEATRQIKQINSDIPIIALTAFGMVGDEEKASEAGCDGYLSNPVNKMTLMEKMAEFVNI
jgi:CheY-like chemotaxis protein